MKRLILATLFLSLLSFNSSVLADCASDYAEFEWNSTEPQTINGTTYTGFVYSNSQYYNSYYYPNWKQAFLCETTPLMYIYDATGVVYYCTSHGHTFLIDNNTMVNCYEYPTGMLTILPRVINADPVSYFDTNVNIYTDDTYSTIAIPANIGQVTLTVAINPSGSGGVSDYPAGENIYCGVDGYEVCEAPFQLNTQVTLDAYPNEGYAFSHWEINGLARADVDGSIDVTMNEAKNVIAVFYLKADDFVFPVLAQGVTDPLLNKTNPIGNGWGGPGVGEYSAAAGHLGQDYVMNYNNGDGDAAGEPVYAVANGTIAEVINNQTTYYGWCNNSDHGWGPVVVIRHENRNGFDTTGSIVTTSCDTETNPTVIYSLYGHLSKTSIQNLQIGQTVTKGQQLGVVGAYGVDQESWTTNHPHFELKDEVGYTEGIWYKTPANEGVCPESTNYTCDSYMVKGVGTAYSMESNFAPHRYEPGAFINANKQ